MEWIMREHVRRLADIEPSETVTVRQILFDGLRSHCAGLGVHEGDRLSIREDPASAVLLVRNPDGRFVPCPEELARFVQVHRDEEA
jgi:hypothetical protein